MVRDVAYDSLPKRDRASLHIDVAGWAESTLEDRIDEFAELIATHLAAALDYEEELAGSRSEPSLRGLRELAYRAAVRAARRAASVSALPAVQRWQRLAIDQARTLAMLPEFSTWVDRALSTTAFLLKPGASEKVNAFLGKLGVKPKRTPK